MLNKCAMYRVDHLSKPPRHISSMQDESSFAGMLSIGLKIWRAFGGGWKRVKEAQRSDEPVRKVPADHVQG
jgi:hypothetical protein